MVVKGANIYNTKSSLLPSPFSPLQLIVSSAANPAFVALPVHHSIVLLTDGYSTHFLAKTAISMLRYRTGDIAAVLESSDGSSTATELFGTGGQVPVVRQLASVPSCDALYLGIAPPGGKIPPQWRPIILEAITRGIDVVSGLHDFLVEDAEFVQAAAATQSHLIDVRRNCFKETAKALAFRPECVRIHSVGHDCSIGKMVTTLELQKGLEAAGHSAKFLASGQTGIMIAGEGVPIDCVVADFVNGAMEQLIAANDHYDYLLIEGQGSISHPAYSAVTAGLLHGCAPDGLIFCYEAGRDSVKGFNKIPIPPMQEQVRALEIMANLRHPCEIIGVAINTRTLSAEAAAKEVEWAEDHFQLPACDVYRDGPTKLVQACVHLRNRLLGKLQIPERS